jgi:hypothetical protein
MLRDIGAVVAGLVVGSVANMALVFANMAVFPGPPGLDFNDPAAMAAYVGGLPPQAFLGVMAAHLSQALLGGWTAARLSGERTALAAYVVGALTALACLVNLLGLPSPWWMWAELPLCGVIVWAVARAEVARRAG